MSARSTPEPAPICELQCRHCGRSFSSLLAGARELIVMPPDERIFNRSRIITSNAIYERDGHMLLIIERLFQRPNQSSRQKVVHRIFTRWDNLLIGIDSLNHLPLPWSSPGLREAVAEAILRSKFVA